MVLHYYPLKNRPHQAPFHIKIGIPPTNTTTSSNLLQPSSSSLCATLPKCSAPTSSNTVQHSVCRWSLDSLWSDHLDDDSDCDGKRQVRLLTPSLTPCPLPRPSRWPNCLFRFPAHRRSRPPDTNFKKRPRSTYYVQHTTPPHTRYYYGCSMLCAVGSPTPVSCAAPRDPCACAPLAPRRNARSGRRHGGGEEGLQRGGHNAPKSVVILPWWLKIELVCSPAGMLFYVLCRFLAREHRSLPYQPDQKQNVRRYISIFFKSTLRQTPPHTSASAARRFIWSARECRILHCKTPPRVLKIALALATCCSPHNRQILRTRRFF